MEHPIAMSKKTMTKGIATSFIALAVAAVTSMAAARELEPAPFRVRGYHQHIFADAQPMSVFHQRLEVLDKHGYNMIVFGMGSPGKSTITMHADGAVTPNGCSTDDMRELVRHAVDLDLEPVFEMKFIGKQIPLLREVIARHPGLVIDPENDSTVLDATYRMPDGRDAYSATALALVNYLLDLYPTDHPAKYFFFGNDEFSSEDMAKLAKKLDMTPARAFAYCLNLGTDHVLAKGVTPLVWGDTMLSPSLGTPEHGLTISEYQPDARLVPKPGGAYHAVYGKGGDHSLHTMVNFLRDRDKIIVVDWHYQPSPTGEFPSMDYFQRVGFKDVWGAPWHDATNIQQFTQYAATREAGGMIATAWHDAYAPESRLLLHFIIGTSAAYFHNPALSPPPTAPVRFGIRGRELRSRDDEKSTGWIARGDGSLEFLAPVIETMTPTDGRLLVTAASRRGSAVEASLSYDAAQRTLRGKFTLPETSNAAQYQVRYCYTDAATGYVVLKEDVQGFVVSDDPPALPAVTDADVLLAGEFSHLEPTDLKDMVWLGGNCAGPLGWAKPRKEPATPRPGGLDTQWFDRIWFLPSDHLNRALCEGMHIHIEAKMTGDFSDDPYCALLTKGSFHTGFRILVGKDGRLLFQFAGLDSKTGGPLAVSTPPGAVPLDRWIDIDLVYASPADGHAGRAEIKIDGKRVAARPVAKPMPVSTAVVGIGCEFGTPLKGPFGKRRPNFPGLIRQVNIHVLP
jgi:hypothetical protein